jgi:hypothetical protein
MVQIDSFHYLRIYGQSIFTMIKSVSYTLVLIGCLTFLSVSTSAQEFMGFERVQHDTNYIRAYKDELTTRVYLSRKQNGYTLSEGLVSPFLKYRTNDNLLLGIGYTYTFLTINLGVKIPFLNKDDDIYGKSKYTDLTLHGIFRSLIVDLYLQWNEGYYISNPEDLVPDWNSQNAYPQRGDMRSNLIGLNVQYLFNSSRYSYKAAFVQNEFQKKSAGSPLAGIEAYWMLAMTDSAMIAPGIPQGGFLGDSIFNQVDIFNVGINGGYAYTFVWDKNLFISLSATAGFSGGKNKVHYSTISNTSYDKLTIGMTSSFRVSLGYNSNSYYVGLSAIHFSMRSMVWDEADWFSYSTGNIKVNVVKRFRLKKPIKILRPDLWVF